MKDAIYNIQIIINGIFRKLYFYAVYNHHLPMVGQIKLNHIIFQVI